MIATFASFDGEVIGEPSQRPCDGPSTEWVDGATLLPYRSDQRDSSGSADVTAVSVRRTKRYRGRGRRAAPPLNFIIGAAGRNRRLVGRFNIRNDARRYPLDGCVANSGWRS